MKTRVQKKLNSHLPSGPEFGRTSRKAFYVSKLFDLRLLKENLIITLILFPFLISGKQAQQENQMEKEPLYEENFIKGKGVKLHYLD